MEQYDRENNLEIIGIPGDFEDQKLEVKVIESLDKIDVNVSSQKLKLAIVQENQKTSQNRNRTIC